MIQDEQADRFDLYKTLNLEELLALEPQYPHDVDLLVKIGGEFLKNRQFDLCHAYYFKAAAIDPNNGWTHLYLGNLGCALSCNDDAVSHFRRASELLPGVACPLWCLAEVFEKQGYWSRTEEYFRRAVEVDPLYKQAEQKLEEWLIRKQKNSTYTHS